MQLIKDVTKFHWKQQKFLTTYKHNYFQWKHFSLSLSLSSLSLSLSFSSPLQTHTHTHTFSPPTHNQHCVNPSSLSLSLPLSLSLTHTHTQTHKLFLLLSQGCQLSIGYLFIFEVSFCFGGVNYNNASIESEFMRMWQLRHLLSFGCDVTIEIKVRWNYLFLPILGHPLIYVFNDPSYMWQVLIIYSKFFVTNDIHLISTITNSAFWLVVMLICIWLCDVISSYVKMSSQLPYSDFFPIAVM